MTPDSASFFVVAASGMEPLVAFELHALSLPASPKLPTYFAPLKPAV